MFFNKSKKLLREALEELSSVQAKNAELEKKYAPLIDVDNVIQQKNQEISSFQSQLECLNSKYQEALTTHQMLEREVELYQDSLDIGSFGLYERVFPFETSEAFKAAIEKNYQKQKDLIKRDEAVVCNTEWTVGGSKVEGRKMTNQFKKLMLYAFNGECDGLIAKVKWNNAMKTKERIMKAYESINKLGQTQNTHITNTFLSLKIEELGLTYEYEQKKFDEKEEQRRIKEQMRDEEKAQRELEKAQKEAEDEEKRFQKALDKAKQELGTAPQANMELLNEQIRLLELKLKEAHERKERAVSMAQLTKVGHIYVISNIGSFGENVYKIGMTRRLDPIDRVKELGDASVPFQFDVHAIIYSDNAPQLEWELHQKFSDRRLNRINNKKEFFKVSLDEIELFVREHAGAEIEFTKLAEAKEYRETIALLHKLDDSLNQVRATSKFPTSIV